MIWRNGWLLHPTVKKYLDARPRKDIVDVGTGNGYVDHVNPNLKLSLRVLIQTLPGERVNEAFVMMATAREETL
jgi:hypothetical protein